MATANLLPPAIAGHDNTLKPVSDIARAKQLLKEAGGLDRELTLFIFGASNIRRAAVAHRRVHDTWPADFHYRQQELGATAAFVATQCGAQGPAHVVSTACSSGACPSRTTGS